MNKKVIYSATEARRDFFKILDTVLNDKNEVYVSKAGHESLIKISLTDSKPKSISDFTGILNDKDYKNYNEVVKKTRKEKTRKVPEFDG